MLTITWNDLLNNAQQPNGLSTSQIKQIEQNVTGNRFVYGLSTPINVVDLLDRVGVFTAIYALDCLAPSTLGIIQAAGIAMLEKWTSIWSFYRPTDQSLLNLITWTNQLLAGQTPGPVNRNSCGDVVSFVSGVTDAFVLTQASNMQNFIDSLTLFKNATGTISTMQVALDNPAIPTLVAPDGTHNLNYIYSPEFIPLPTTLPGYVEHPLLEPDPQTGVPTLTTDLLIKEDQSFLTYVTNHPGTANPFVTVYNNPNFVTSVIPDDAQTAINYLGQAAVLQAQAVANGVSLLSSIAQLIDQAVKHYSIDQRQQIIDIQYELLQVYGGAVPVESLYDYANNGSVYAAQVIAAGNAKKAALFLDYSFWQSYDANQDGQLDMTERYNAEVALLAAYYKATGDEALALYNTLSAELTTWVGYVSDIGAVLRPYLL